MTPYIDYQVYAYRSLLLFMPKTLLVLISQKYSYVLKNTLRSFFITLLFDLFKISCHVAAKMGIQIKSECLTGSDNNSSVCHCIMASYSEILVTTGKKTHDAMLAHLLCTMQARRHVTKADIFV